MKWVWVAISAHSALDVDTAYTHIVNKNRAACKLRNAPNPDTGCTGLNLGMRHAFERHIEMYCMCTPAHGLRHR